MCVSIHGIRLTYDSISAVSIEAESLSLCVEKILRYPWDSSSIGRARDVISLCGFKSRLLFCAICRHGSMVEYQFTGGVSSILAVCSNHITYMKGGTHYAQQ